jgi:hypothetical protein
MLMKQLHPDHIKAAVARIDAGDLGGFAESTKYDLLLGGKRYAPKRVIGLALNELSGLTFDPYDFKGGEASNCFKTLQRLHFDVVDKSGKHFPKPKYNLLTREWVIDALKALGGRATPAEIQAWIKPRRPDFKASNVGPDLQLLTVNHQARSNHFHNKKPRRCDGGDEFDLLFQEDSGHYVFYEPKVHGIWELAQMPGDIKLRPRLVLNTKDSAAMLAALQKAEANHEFDAKNAEDARERAMRQIALRQGQPKFRRDLLTAYGGKCAVTRCDAHDALEAAHIVRYKGKHTNSVRNGLLLRADIHTLFDVGLFRVDPKTYKIVIAPQLARTTYASLAGVKLHLPHLPSLYPDPEALKSHGDDSLAKSS